MKINVTTPIVAYDDQPVKNGDKVVTFKDAVHLAMNSMTEGDQNMTADQKMTYYGVTHKLWSGDEVDFTVEELGAIKERCGKLSTPLVYGRVIEIIEPKDRA